tara:strand:- start:281 stop:538 length:258 start_codon:yes stop_codon:yes gene_type:complete
MKWQPIKTAPKDGTAVLIHRNIWPGTKSGFSESCKGHNTYVAEWWGDPPNNLEGCWMCFMDTIEDPDCPIKPTHWMPLPDPPAVS